MGTVKCEPVHLRYKLDNSEDEEHLLFLTTVICACKFWAAGLDEYFAVFSSVHCSVIILCAVFLCCSELITVIIHHIMMAVVTRGI